MPTDLEEKVGELQSHAKAPIYIGFGISTPEQAAAAASAGDGCIVGSHLVRILAEHGQSPDIVDRLAGRVAELAAAVHAVQQ